MKTKFSSSLIFLLLLLLQWGNSQPVKDDEECPSDMFACHDGYECVSKAAHCDAVADCYDGSDEHNCPCPDDYFRCHDGYGCLKPSFICDNWQDCYDSSDETGCPVDGGFTDFTDWSTCSVTCGGGQQERSRTCTNPAPAKGGADCVGDAVESRACNVDACPGGPCPGGCGVNAHCDTYEGWCRCDDGFIGHPDKHCVGRSDAKLIRKLYLGYLDNKPPSDTCFQGSDRDISVLPECTLRQSVATFFGCWQPYVDGFPYGSNKNMCIERVAGIANCLASSVMRCLSLYCHSDAHVFGLAYNEGGVKETDKQWKTWINKGREIFQPWVNLTYDEYLYKLHGGHSDRMNQTIYEYFCPDLGEVPVSLKAVIIMLNVNNYHIPVTSYTEEKYCKKGITSELQKMGMNMTYKWFSSRSKAEIEKAYESFKRKSAELFLTSCKNVTKVYQAFLDDFGDYPAGPYDMEIELATSLAWKFYLVATDFMMKHWYPDSEIYDQSLWTSANSLAEKNVISGQISNYFAMKDKEEKDNKTGKESKRK